jgi:hypothetical protein
LAKLPTLAAATLVLTVALLPAPLTLALLVLNLQNRLAAPLFLNLRAGAVLLISLTLLAALLPWVAVLAVVALLPALIPLPLILISLVCHGLSFKHRGPLPSVQGSAQNQEQALQIGMRCRRDMLQTRNTTRSRRREAFRYKTAGRFGAALNSCRQCPNCCRHFDLLDAPSADRTEGSKCVKSGQLLFVLVGP